MRSSRVRAGLLLLIYARVTSVTPCLTCAKPPGVARCFRHDGRAGRTQASADGLRDGVELVHHAHGQRERLRVTELGVLHDDLLHAVDAQLVAGGGSGRCGHRSVLFCCSKAVLVWLLCPRGPSGLWWSCAVPHTQLWSVLCVVLVAALLLRVFVSCVSCG